MPLTTETRSQHHSNSEESSLNIPGGLEKLSLDTDKDSDSASFARLYDLRMLTTPLESGQMQGRHSTSDRPRSSGAWDAPRLSHSEYVREKHYKEVKQKRRLERFLSHKVVPSFLK